MSVNDVFVSLLVAGLLLVVAKLLRNAIALFRTLFLPASVIAGVLGLLLGPQVLGGAFALLGLGETWHAGVLPEPVLEAWSRLPSLLISVVFATLFIGKVIPSVREIWRIAGPQVALGQSIAWGQYVVGIALALLVLSPVFGLDPIAGALIEIGFEGGHGTAAGLAETFEAFGFPEGSDLALGLATIGLVAGVLLGTVLVNWGVRTGRITLNEAGDPVEAARDATHDDLDDIDERERVARREQQTTDPLSIHVGYVAIAISLGWLLQQGLALVERATWGGEGGVELLVHMPLFPLAMLGGVMLQLVLERTGQASMVDRKLINRLGGFSLDLIIVAALATLSLDALGGNLVPFALLALAGISWNLAAYLLLAPRIIPEHAYERGLGDFGQSMGMTVTGLLLMRIADPRNRSGGLEAFGYKQLLFEPVVGGGLFTAASIPLIAQFGPLPVLLFTGALTVFWVVYGIRRFGPGGRQAER